MLPAPVESRWLAAEEACELAFTPPLGADAASLLSAIRHALAGVPIDVNVVPAARRRKKLLIADMDSTIIGQECIDEIADFAGLKTQVATITERAMRGEIDFETALRKRVALLKGLEEAVLQRVFDERVRLNPGARVLTATMRARGAACVLVTGGFTFFASRVAALAGFDHVQANRLAVQGGRLTGRVEEPILGRSSKLEALRRHSAERGLSAEDTLAVGDGANDLAMLAAAGLGVAFRAKPIVAAQARARVEHGDLSALLFLQGYTREEFTPIADEGEAIR